MSYLNSASSNDSAEQKATLFALLTVVFWSTVATAFKIGLRSLDPAQLIFIASIVTVILLFVLLLVNGKAEKLKHLSKKTFVHSLILGFLNPFSYYLILFEAYTRLPAQVAQPINMVWPIVLVLLSVPLLKQKIKWPSILALLISFVGVFLISTQGKFYTFGDTDLFGIALGVLSAFVWSFFWLLNVRSKEDEIIKLFLNFLFGTVFLGGYIFLFSDFNFQADESLWAGIYIGFFEIGIAFVLWMKALSLTKNNARLANLIYIAPFLSLIFIHFILGEEIYSTTVIGIFFIISGILFQQKYRPKRQQNE